MGIPADSPARGITVTIKYGKGYEQPWAVFHGSTGQIRDDLTAFFGMNPDETAGLTLSDLVVNAMTSAHAVGVLASGMSATVIASHGREPAASRPDAAKPGTPAAPPSAAPPAEAVANPLLAVIAQVPDVRSLERLWAENQAAFSDPEVMAAWKARGRALSTAG
jgi:hypothetical protein